MKPAAERAGWIGMQIEATLDIFGKEPDVEGYVSEFLDCLRDDVVEALRNELWLGRYCARIEAAIAAYVR